MNGADYRLDDASGIESPALLIFREVLERNLERMIRMAGAPGKLRPHVKTHKMPALVRLLEERGIHKHKCATIAEAEMAASAGAGDVLLGYPLVGPNVARWGRLTALYPATQFRATVDHPDAARLLARAAMESDPDRPFRVLVDVEIGMGRTGIAPEGAFELYRLIGSLPGLEPDGLHGYDGHVRARDAEERRAAAARGAELLFALRARLNEEGLPVPRMVLGGTPTFPAHARQGAVGVECSPGTCLLHDHSYMTLFPDLPFEPAALLLCRVISKPSPGRVCLDLGYKAVAADPREDRARLLGLEGAVLGAQSEEHLVVELGAAREPALGAEVLAVPTHVCPTCALHREALVVEGGRVVDCWPVAGRDRRLTC